MTAERINYICRLRHLLLKADIDYVERYILPLPICSYNLYKSGSDMLHKEMLPLTHLATGTHRKMSISALMIMQVTAFRMIKMTMALKKLENADTVEHMLDIINDERAVGELALDLGLYMNPSRFCSRPQRIVSAVRPTRNDPPSETYRPDLPKYRLRMAKLRDLAVSKQGNTVIPANATPVGVSKIAQPFILNSELSEIRTRSHHMLQHSVVARNHRTERGSCDIYCMACEGEMKKGNLPKDDHPRHAYRASSKCSFCQVNLCIVKRKIWGGKTCNEWFHS